MDSFFNHYKNQSDDFLTYFLIDDHDQIVSMASLIFREAFIEGKKQTVGYATDLRVSNHRKAILNWSQHFLPILEQERGIRDCKYVFSIVGQNQRQAYNAFIRPRSTRRKIPRYYLFRRFNIVGLHGLLPWAPPPLKTIHILKGEENDLDELNGYIQKKKRNRPINYYVSESAFAQQLDRWSELNVRDFYIARNHKGEIIGCVAPWSADHIQRFYPTRYDNVAWTFHDALQVGSYVGLTKRLPNLNGDHFEYNYLTHMFADNPDILYTLLREVWRNLEKREFLVYAHFDSFLMTLPPQGFIHSILPYGYYCILNPHEKIPDFLKPNHLNEPPDFELAFL